VFHCQQISFTATGSSDQRRAPRGQGHFPRFPLRHFQCRDSVQAARVIRRLLRHSMMPRQPRPDLAGIARHIVQRGSDRQPCFFQPSDYDCHLTQLRECAARHELAIHAYVLMTNHVHLLAPPKNAGGMSAPTSYVSAA
jgi:hypothetical protein